MGEVHWHWQITDASIKLIALLHSRNCFRLAHLFTQHSTMPENPEATVMSRPSTAAGLSDDDFNSETMGDAQLPAPAVATIRKRRRRSESPAPLPRSRPQQRRPASNTIGQPGPSCQRRQRSESPALPPGSKRSKPVHQRQEARFTGAWWNENRGKWTSEISCHGVRHNLGSFTKEVDAAVAYDRAAVSLRGKDAKINFPLSDYTDAAGEIIVDQGITQKLETSRCKQIFLITLRFVDSAVSLSLLTPITPS